MTIQPAIISGRYNVKRYFLVFVVSLPHADFLDGDTGVVRDWLRETETANNCLLLLSLAVELAKVPLNSTIQVTLAGRTGFWGVSQYLR